MRPIAEIAKTVTKFVGDNSPAILTALGATGTITTAILTGKATWRAAHRLENEDPHAPTKEKVGMVWKFYIPPVAVGSITIACIICANNISSRRTTALATAFSLSDSAFKEYREAVVEQIGVNKEEKLRGEVAKAQMERNPLSKNEIIVAGGGDVLFYESLTGRYFTSDMETLRRAQNDINHEIITGDGNASQNDFFRKVGLASVGQGDEVGWNTDHLLDLLFSPTMNEEGNRPCIAISYQYGPKRDYYRFH